jgi:hypothetical protein
VKFRLSTIVSSKCKPQLERALKSSDCGRYLLFSSAMFSSQCAVLFVLAINFRLVKGFMPLVGSADGSFVPWSLMTRAPKGPLAVRMINNLNQAYLVSLYRNTSLLITDQSYRQLSRWVGFRFPPCSPTLSHSVVISCDRHSSSRYRNGRFSFAELHLSGNVSGRCGRPIVVRMILNLDIQSPDLFGHSYDATASTTYTLIDGTANITTISGGNTVSQYAGEMCTLKSGTNDASFTYNAAGMYMYYFLSHSIDLRFASSRLHRSNRDNRSLSLRRTRCSWLWSQHSSWLASKYLLGSHVFTVSRCPIPVSSHHHD